VTLRPKLRIAGLAAATMSLLVLVPTMTASAATVDRWSGPDRYATAAAISLNAATAPAPVVFVATGTGFPDALAGGPAAASLGGPVLLVSQTAIPAATAAELTRLTPAKIVILGGTSSVSAAVETGLATYAPTVVRWAGADRYATAATISANTFSPGVADAFVSTGATFPDALSGAAAAGFLHAPVLLVPADAIPAATAAELTRLAPARITVLGGTNAVTAGVFDALAAFTSGSVRRLSGVDRYATSAAVASAVFSTATHAFIATGTDFPDALAGGPAAGAAAGPILLSQTACVPDVIADQLDRLAPATVTLLGGTNALGAGVAALTRCSLYTPPAPPAALFCAASMSDPTPAQQTNDIVNVTTLPGAAIQAAAHYKTTTTTHFGTADASGAGVVEFQIANATVGFTVQVNVTVSLGGKVATCSTSFTTR
jgi:putative cell wall-binding protein